MNNPDAIFQPLEFRNLTIRNRLIRSSLTPGLVDHYDGTGTEVRINFEVKYARTGLGAIISGFAAIHDRGVIAPGHAHIDRDDRIPFWRELVRRVHKHECPYIIQLLFAGRQREVAEMLHYEVGLSSTDKPDFYRGTPTERMTTEQIGMVVDAFGQAARRAREAGADGVEIHGANGFLLTQFLSKAINDRTDEYGGSLENRARLPIEVVREVRKQVGDDFHVQFKISAVEHASDLYPWLGKGNTIEDSMRVCKWLEEAGVDAFHVSTGIAFPNPRMPPGKLPLDDRVFNIVSVRHKLGVLLLHTPLNALLRYRWEKPTRGREEGLILPDTAALKMIEWSSNPPATGSHYWVWARWNRAYTDPVPRGHYVHNLEHGGVVLLYNCPDGCADDIAGLQAVLDALPAESEVREPAPHAHAVDARSAAARGRAHRGRGVELDLYCAVPQSRLPARVHRRALQPRRRVDLRRGRLPALIDRRRFLAGSAAALLAACGRPSPRAPYPPAQWIADATLDDLARKLASGEVTSRGLVEAYLARIEALDRRGPTLRSVIEINPDALAIADALDRERREKGAARPAARHPRAAQGQHRHRRPHGDHRRLAGAGAAHAAARRVRRRSACARRAR